MHSGKTTVHDPGDESPKKEDKTATLPLWSDTVRWAEVPPKQIASRLDTDFEIGLSSKRVGELIKRYGHNSLPEKRGLGFLGKVFDQFKSPLVLILLFAGIATIALNQLLDAAVIFIALFINVIIGLFQGERASLAFQKLRDSQEKFASVMRDGKRVTIAAKDLVVGDIAVIEAGMNVPADIRILEANDFSVNESALTGEWATVGKEKGTLKKHVPLAEQYNMAWMGTLVASGYAKGVVVETGEDTQIGAVAEKLLLGDTVTTPIQKNIKKLALFISYFVIAAVILIFFLGLLRGETISEMLLIAIAIAVSVVPEGLPAAVTVVLALGMEKILKRGGLVRNLLAAETLGSTTVILTDKTGTLTEAKMVLSDLITVDSFGKKNDSEETKYNTEEKLLQMAVITSDAFTEQVTEEEELIVRGRPIERAIVLAGLSRGISQLDLDKRRQRIDFVPFSSEARSSFSLNTCPNHKTNHLYLSGAPEPLLENATHIFSSSGVEPITPEIKEHFRKAQVKGSKEGKRFIAIAYKHVREDMIKRTQKGKPSEDILGGLIFAGLLSFTDPVRKDVRGAIKEAKEAGALVVMVTGDNPETALSIAKESGIVEGHITKVIQGIQIDEWSDKELYENIKKNKVFARVLPSQKLRIVNVLRSSGEVVAMTGDGINDAPALRSADIGVAVGSGTEVAKEASDLVLLNNSFSIIVSAIEEGRRIIDNLRKIVTQSVSTSFGEIFLIGGSLLLGLSIPILPTQILWVNIIEGGLLNFAFAFEPKEDDIMKRKPNSPEASSFITKDVRSLIYIVGTVTGLFTLILFVLLFYVGTPIDELRTLMFITLSLDSIFFTLSLKSFKKPIWKIKLFSNKFLLLSLFVSIATLFLALFVPTLKTILHIVPIERPYIFVLLGVAVFNLLTIELTKYILFERRGENATMVS